MDSSACAKRSRRPTPTCGLATRPPAGDGAGAMDQITFAQSLAGQSIVLGGVELTVSDRLAITGPGADSLTISGNQASGVFSIAAGVTAEISGGTIADGNAVYGGGIYNEGTLTVQNSKFTNNSVTSYGYGGERSATTRPTVNSCLRPPSSTACSPVTRPTGDGAEPSPTSTKRTQPIAAQ